MDILKIYKDQSVGKKLITGFLFIALFVGIVGAIGVSSLNAVMETSDEILDVNVPHADASMEAMIAVILGRDAMGEYMLTDDPEELEGINAEYDEYIEDHDKRYSVVSTKNHY